MEEKVGNKMLNEKKYQYREITTNEIVEDFMAKDYVLTKLGLKENGKLVVIPRGKNGEFTLEQKDFIESTPDWFFSGNWIKQEVKEN